MNKISNEKLDLLWAMASDEFVKDILNEAAPTESDVKPDDHTRNRILRQIRKNHRKTKLRIGWKVLRIAMVACLAAAALALVACMAFPTVREAIWKVVLEWGDESVKIDFVPADDPDYSTSTDPSVTTSNDPIVTTTVEPTDEPDTPIVTPPTSIEEINIPGYMPVGYTVTSNILRKSYMLDYYNADGESVITFKQTLINAESWGDAEEGTAANITINGLNAILITNATNNYN